MEFPIIQTVHIVKWLIGLPFFVKGVPKASVITTYSGTKYFCTPSNNKVSKFFGNILLVKYLHTVEFQSENLQFNNRIHQVLHLTPHSIPL